MHQKCIEELNRWIIVDYQRVFGAPKIEFSVKKLDYLLVDYLKTFGPSKRKPKAPVLGLNKTLLDCGDPPKPGVPKQGLLRLMEAFHMSTEKSSSQCEDAQISEAEEKRSPWSVSSEVTSLNESPRLDNLCSNDGPSTNDF